MRASNSITPKLYQSEAKVSGSPAACSGDMYGAVPASESDSSMLPSAETRPKSRITRRPSGVTRTLEGLRSRWSLPARWMASMPTAS